MTADLDPRPSAAGDGAPPEVDLHRLLGRPPLPIDEKRLAAFLAGKRILITGAGGSIGSCLSARLLTWGAGETVFLDSHEHSLYDLQGRLGCGDGRVYRLADVRDAGKMRRLLSRHRPQVVFHLAAYKHVPLGEQNPDEVVVANVVGTLNVLRAAAEAGVETFVYPSTDKAVYPPSVYGASKRTVELLLRAFTREVGRPCCTIVRLVNAVGAQGGVIRVFARQIAAGGPLTLTHEGMTRYWISIDEAALAVAAAACAGEPLVLVPDVGPAVRLTTVAKRLQALLRPGAPLKIEVVGLRPGERLAEALVRDDEALVPGPCPGVLAVRDLGAPRPSLAEVLAAVDRLRQLAAEGDDEGLRRFLGAFVGA